MMVLTDPHAREKKQLLQARVSGLVSLTDSILAGGITLVSNARPHTGRSGAVFISSGDYTGYNKIH
jgi:hypothetical protein